jgi:hypothetical protein
VLAATQTANTTPQPSIQLHKSSAGQQHLRTLTHPQQAPQVAQQLTALLPLLLLLLLVIAAVRVQPHMSSNVPTSC